MLLAGGLACTACAARRYAGDPWPGRDRLGQFESRWYGVGGIDCIHALLLIGMLYVPDFPGGCAAQWAFWLLGFGIIGLALLTGFEVGVIRLVPMPVHLGIDVPGGLLLAASPRLFGFADRISAPYLVFGLLEAGLALATRTAPEGEPARRAA